MHDAVDVRSFTETVMNPSPMTKYEAVRAKIVEACSELVELSPGCEIRCSFQGGKGYHLFEKRYFLYAIREREDKTDKYYFAADGVGETGLLKRYDISEIIGHPIRLSHVLRAIRKADNERREFYLFGKLERDMSKIEGEVCSRFNLEKDDLSLERPETIDFLFKILCE